MQHWVKGGYNYYYNLKTKEGTWDEPAEFTQNNTQLNKDEIQVNTSKYRQRLCSRCSGTVEWYSEGKLIN